MTMSRSFAVIGAGPWAMAVLDRMVTTARRLPQLSFQMTLIDPDAPGPGVHKPEQAPFLLLNTVSGQIDSFSARHFGEPSHAGAVSFLEWLEVARGLRANPNGFMPRALFGEYLRHVYQVLVSNAPPNLLIEFKQAVAVELELGVEGRPQVVLAAGGRLMFDHVFVCTGHGLAPSAEDASPRSNDAISSTFDPYPIAALHNAVEPGACVGIAGMGLTAVDVVAAFTEGRGGHFKHDSDHGLVYIASGQEPTMQLFSRTGSLFSCRPSVSFDLSLRYEPVFCRPANLEDPVTLSRMLDLLCAEMRAAYLMRSIALSSGESAAARAFDALRAMAPEMAMAYVTAHVSPTDFDPDQLLRPSTPSRFDSSAHFTTVLKQRLEFDVGEAVKGEAGSPFKYAVEMLRVVRPFIRTCVDHAALDPRDRRAFYGEVAPRISQLVVGPPVERGRQWLALMKAGLLKVGLGPGPELQRDFSRKIWRARSTRFEQVFATCLDGLVRGRLGAGNQGPLIQACYRAGLFAARPHMGSEGGCGLVPNTDPWGHPIDATETPLLHLTLLGTPTEGVTYFNHYLPSPKSRSHAFERIQQALDLALAY